MTLQMEKDDGIVKVSKIIYMSNLRCDMSKGVPWITCSPLIVSILNETFGLNLKTTIINACIVTM